IERMVVERLEAQVAPARAEAPRVELPERPEIARVEASAAPGTARSEAPQRPVLDVSIASRLEQIAGQPLTAEQAAGFGSAIDGLRGLGLGVSPADVRDAMRGATGIDATATPKPSVGGMTNLFD